MKRAKEISTGFVRSAKGVTLIELIIVVVLIGILSMLAFPSYLQWRRNLEYRETARNINSMLRDARNRAISTNFQHRVELENANGRYRMTQGDRASDSQNWNTIVQNWAVLRTGVAMNASAASIAFNPNGTSTAAVTVQIQDATPTTRYTVSVATTGRIWITP